MAQSTDIFSTLKAIQENGIGFPEIISQWIIPIFIAFVAFALPMISQTVQTLDNKYDTVKMVRAFKQNIFMRLLWPLLLGVFGLLLIWFIFRYFEIDLILATTILEIVLFLISLFLVGDVIALAIAILTYCDPEKLQKKAVNKYKSWKLFVLCKKDSFSGIIEGLIRYSIKNNNHNSAIELAKVLGEIYQEKHNKSNLTSEDYQLILDINELLCSNNRWNLFCTSNPIKSWIPIDLILSERSLNDKDIEILWECFSQYIKHKEFERIKVLWNHITRCYNISYNDLDSLIILAEEMCAVLYSQREFNLLDSIISGYCDDDKQTDSIFNMHPFPKKDFFSQDSKTLILRYISHYDTINKSPRRISSVDISQIVKPIDYYASLFAFAFGKVSSANNAYPFYVPNEINDLVKPINYNEIIDRLKKAATTISADRDITKILQNGSWTIILTDFLKSLDEVMADYCSLDSISKSKRKLFDGIIIDTAKRAIGDIEIFSHRKRWTKYRALFEPVNSYSILDKDLFREYTINIPTRNSLKDTTNDIYCGIVTYPVKALNKMDINHHRESYNEPDELLESLNKTITTINNPDEWIIIADCDKGYYVLYKNSSDKKYRNIDIYYSPISRSNDDTCQIWLLKKEDLPYYIFGTTFAEDKFYDYRLTQIEDNLEIRRLIYDVGNFKQEVRDELKKRQQTKGLTDTHLDTSILSIVRIPMKVIYNEFSTVYSYTLKNIPEQWQDIMEYENDYDECDDYYDYYVGNNNSISAEDYNSRVIEEEEEIRNSNTKTVDSKSTVKKQLFFSRQFNKWFRRKKKNLYPTYR